MSKPMSEQMQKLANRYEKATAKKLDVKTNAQKIRGMSDEEIAEYVCRNSINTLCDIICGGECNAIATLKRTGDFVCKEIVKKWLQQPAEEDDHA